MARITQKEKVREALVSALYQNPQGLRYAELMERIQNAWPDMPSNTIRGAIYELGTSDDPDIFKPGPGLYKLRNIDETSVDEVIKQNINQKKIQESDFYELFAQWLREDLGECTESIAFGGNRLGKKWGTPDIIGVNRPSKRALIQYDPEIITAEIKLDPSEVITAFGQAVAYRLFSNKVYLALPEEVSTEDKSRMEALCMLFGVGLVLFRTDPSEPDFQIRVRAQKHSTDMFYTNDFVDRLDKSDSRSCKILFGG